MIVPSKRLFLLLAYCILVSGAPHCEKKPAIPECARCPQHINITGVSCPEPYKGCLEPNNFEYVGAGGLECMKFRGVCPTELTLYIVASGKNAVVTPPTLFDGYAVSCNSTGWFFNRPEIGRVDTLTGITCLPSLN